MANDAQLSFAAPPSRRPLFAGLLVADVLLTLFPPLYWAAGGSPAGALTYFIGGGFLVLLSLLLMNRVEQADEARGKKAAA